jgi:hypothetical protein
MVGGRVTIPVREALEAQAESEGIKLGTLTAKLLNKAAKRFLKTQESSPK